MGGNQSRIATSNMDDSKGRLSPDMKCLGGNTPTIKTKHITLHKLERLNFRKYDIKQGDELLCVSRQVLFDLQSFELLAADETTKLVRCQKGLVSKTWHIYSYISPAFEGQTPDKGAYKDEEETDETKAPIYKVYELVWNRLKGTAELCPVAKDDTGKEGKGVLGDPVYEIQKVKGMKEIYQLCHVGGEKALVSHWHWEGQKIELVVAKGSDLAVHCIIAVICNIMKESEAFPWLGVLTN